jgi:hypothetical protein
LAAPVPPGAARENSLTQIETAGAPGLEVVARRAGDDDVLVLLCRAHAEERLGRDHERPQVERAAFDRREPVAVGQHELAHRFEEQRLWQLGHGEARAEALNRAALASGGTGRCRHQAWR